MDWWLLIWIKGITAEGITLTLKIKLCTDTPKGSWSKNEKHSKDTESISVSQYLGSGFCMNNTPFLEIAFNIFPIQNLQRFWGIWRKPEKEQIWVDFSRFLFLQCNFSDETTISHYFFFPLKFATIRNPCYLPLQNSTSIKYLSNVALHDFTRSTLIL
jgi:hypothetical protein